MADDGFPPLPKGFEVDTGSGGDFPALPKGFSADAEPSSQSGAPLKANTPVRKLAKGEFDKQLIETIKDGYSKNLPSDVTKQKVDKFLTDQGYNPGGADETIKGVYNGAMLTDRVEHPDDTLPAIQSFGRGLATAPVDLVHGLAKLGLTAAQKAGLISDVDANMAKEYLVGKQKAFDATNNQGVSGTLGNLAGQAATFAAAPELGPGAGLAAKVATRAATGGATAAASSADQDQGQAALIGAAASPLLTPVFERLSATLGGAIGSAYTKVLSRGVGQQIIDPATGALTRYGSVLRARLRSINPSIPDKFVDESLRGIAQQNAKVLPADKDIVATGLAASENVPLTGAMKSRDAKGIQDLGSMQTGSVAKHAQQAAIDTNQNIDDAIIGNVKKVGSGQERSDAADNLGIALASREATSAAKHNTIYEDLKNSAEKVTRPDLLKSLRDSIYNDFGQSGTDTLSSTASNFMNRLNALSNNEKLRFGNLWKFSRDLNEAKRGATGEDIAQLGDIKKAFDSFLAKAPDDFTEGGANGALKQMRDANALYAQHKATFGSNAMRQGASKFTDTAGKGVERVLALTKNAINEGKPIPSNAIEKAVFGGSTLERATDAPATIAKVIKAAPEAQPHIKDIVVNKLVDSITNAGDKINLKANAHKVINGVIDNNRPVLEAAGFTSQEIESLQRNAYLASLKSPPVGAIARGSSATNRGVGASVSKAAFRSALRVTLAAAGFHEAGALGGIAATAVGEGAAAAGSAIMDRRLAQRALSLNTPTPLNEAGSRAGRKAGSAVGAQAARSISQTASE